MNKEELQKMANEHFEANKNETKCYATSDGNVWMAKDKSFAERHAVSIKETVVEFIRQEKAKTDLKDEADTSVKEAAPKKAAPVKTATKK